MASHRGCGVSPPRPSDRLATPYSSRTPPISFAVAAVVRASSRYFGGRSEKLGVGERPTKPQPRGRREQRRRVLQDAVGTRLRAGTRGCCWRRWSRPGRVRRPPRDTSRRTSSRTGRQRNARPARTDPERVRDPAACGDRSRSAHHRADSRQDHSNHAPPGRRRTLGCRGPQRARSTPSTPRSRPHRAQESRSDRVSRCTPGGVGTVPRRRAARAWQPPVRWTD